MKRLSAILAIVLMLGLSFAPMKAQAAVDATISSYTEVMKPVGEVDGELTVTVKGTAGTEGYLYLMVPVKGMTPAGEVTGENVEGELEAYKEGGNSYFRIKVTDTAAEATVTAKFTCAEYYKISGTAETNGGSNFVINYKFTNLLSTKIAKYNLTVFVPEGNEVVKVSTPSAYADYILSEEDGLRAAGLSTSLASAGAATLKFSYNAPISMVASILVWVICLGIGGFVAFDRWNKATKG
jgi:hypothetical protein